MNLEEYLEKQTPEVKSTISLAVWIIDEYSGGRPQGNVRVRTEAAGAVFVRNPGGYYLLKGSTRNEIIIRVESEYYAAETKKVRLSKLDPRQPVVTIPIRPKPAYPFPAGATLIRGMVKNERQEGLAGAVVLVKGMPIETTTNTKGEFVYFFPTLSEEQVTIKKGKKYLRGEKGRIVMLMVTYNSRTGRIGLTDVEEGQTRVLEEPVIIKEKTNKTKSKKKGAQKPE